MIGVWILLLAQVDDPQTSLSVAPLAAPAVGNLATDPRFGVAVRRLTDRGQGGGLATAEYPQLQAVNADETRVLLSTEAGYAVMELATGRVTHPQLDMVLPRWSPTDPDVLLHLNQRGEPPIILQRTELMGGMFMTSDVLRISDLGFTSLEQGSWEDFSTDGRYVALLGQRSGQRTVAVLDLMLARLDATLTSNVPIDWVAISPSGQYLVVQYPSRGLSNTDGLVVYNARDGAFLGHLTDHGDHGDLGVDRGGREIFATIAYTDFCANGAVACFSVAPLPNAVEADTQAHLRTLPAGNYTSCRAHRRGGFCLNADDYQTPGAVPFAKEVWITRLADGAVRRLFHHRSSGCSYYLLSRPTLSPSGRWAFFSSDWARENCADQADLYVIDLEAHLDNWLDQTPVPDGGVPTPDTGFADTGQPDAGFPVDATPGADAAPELDAAVAPDATAGLDAAPRPGNARTGTTGGCVAANFEAQGVWLLLLPFLRRRRR